VGGEWRVDFKTGVVFFLWGGGFSQWVQARIQVDVFLCGNVLVFVISEVGLAVFCRHAVGVGQFSWGWLYIVMW